MLWDYVGHENPMMRLIYYTVRDVVPRFLMAIAIIWFGIYLLRGKKVSEEPVPRIEQKQAGTENVQNDQQNKDGMEG